MPRASSPPSGGVATIARRPERTHRLAEERAGRADRRQLQRAARTAAPNVHSPSRTSGRW
jgi:hypothetical protein